VLEMGTFRIDIEVENPALARHPRRGREGSPRIARKERRAIRGQASDSRRLKEARQVYRFRLDPNAECVTMCSARLSPCARQAWFGASIRARTRRGRASRPAPRATPSR
jgi:hypothetical protein